VKTFKLITDFEKFVSDYNQKVLE